MKKISKILLFVFVSSLSLVSCNDLLDVNSQRLVSTNSYDMTAANDTLYSMFGVFSQLEKVADSYVLLGELRGDLMQVTDSSDRYLKQIYNWDITSDNPYANNLKDYYSVINNCNYIINKLDTSIVSGGEKVMYKEFAACKAIRAWTYMQIALNYGKAVYYDKPILSLSEAEASYPVYTMQQLAPVLIADLEPWKDIREPNFNTSLFTFNTSYAFFPIRFLLGDLNLWMGAYTNDTTYDEKAATYYHDLMYNKSYCIYKALQSSYNVVANTFSGKIDAAYSYWGSDLITAIGATNEYGSVFKLDSLVLNRMIAPSQVAINDWKSQRYFYGYNNGTPVDTMGDLRLYPSVSPTKYDDWTGYVPGYSANDINASSPNYLYKYIYINPILDKKEASKVVMIYRVGLLYLRYAEAVNRLGKPNLAMATLKYGLNAATLSNNKEVPASEKPDPLPDYMDFTSTRFNGVIGTTNLTNMGVHMRGCGNVDKDTTYYRIPNDSVLNVEIASGNPKQDSIIYVENLIVKELALEDAFEGNRFHDLMRFAIRRNDPSFLADKVAAKYTTDQAAIKAKLEDESNWYIKY